MGGASKGVVGFCVYRSLVFQVDEDADRLIFARNSRTGPRLTASRQISTTAEILKAIMTESRGISGKILPDLKATATGFVALPTIHRLVWSRP